MRPTTRAWIVLLAWSVFAAVQPAAAQDPVYAVDISHWTGEITDEDVACWWENGVRHVITGTLYPSITTNHLETAINGGMSVDAYVYLYWGYNITEQVEDALTLTAPYPIQRLWLDAEQKRGSFTQAQIVQKIQEAVNACGTMPCGIYTRKLWWEENTGDSKAFNELPLWYAYYDNVANFDDWYDPAYWFAGPFGGWTDPTGKQYSDRPHLCDLIVDHNIMYTLEEVPPPETPPAPTGLSPDGTSFSNDASVTLHCNALAGVTSYEFEVWYQSGSTWNLFQTYSPNTNSKTFSPTYDNTAYKWHVRGHNAAGAGAWSAWATFNMGTVASTPPAPTAVSPADGSTVLTDSVKLSVSPIAGATNHEFEIWYQDGEAFVYYYTYSTTTSSKTFWPSYDDTIYQWKARARNAFGWGEWSAFSTFKFGNVPTNPPPAPTGLSPNNNQTFENDGSVTLTCTAAADASQYEFEIQYQSGATWYPYYTYSAGTNSKTFWPSYNNMSYQWKVRAHNTGGWGAWSAWATFRMGVAAPAAPTGLTASSISASRIDLGWADASTNETGFKIERKKGSGGTYAQIATVGANVTTYSNTGLAAETIYYYRARAYNTAGNSAFSNAASATTRPPAPTGLTATVVSASQVNLAWTDTSTAESGFRVYRKTDGGSYSLTATVGANVKTYSNTGLVAGTLYYYKVHAYNAGGNSAASNVVSVTPTNGLPAPTGLSPNNGQVISTSSVTLSCAAVSGATQYEFYIEYQSGSVWVYYYTYTSTTRSKTFYPSVHGTSYRWKVRAKNASSTSPWSALATFFFN